MVHWDLIEPWVGLLALLIALVWLIRELGPVLLRAVRAAYSTVIRRLPRTMLTAVLALELLIIVLLVFVIAVVGRV